MFSLPCCRLEFQLFIDFLIHTHQQQCPTASKTSASWKLPKSGHSYNLGIFVRVQTGLTGCRRQKANMSLLGLPGLTSEMITILALLILLKQTSPRQATLVANPCSACRNCSIGVSGAITVAKKALLGVLCTPE